MNKIEIGEVISKLRKEKGLTQEQLANFVGVSTPAVSKWESGVSYPDITMLPTLARFFNITIDYLLNYNNILSEEEENEIFLKCQEEFQIDTEKALILSLSYIEKYNLNYNLKFRLAVLINTSYGVLGGEESLKKAYGKTIPIFNDIIQNCSTYELVNGSKIQIATSYTAFEEHDKAIEMLNSIETSNVDTTILLSGIYMQKGDIKEARKLLQRRLLVQITEILASINSLATISSEKEEFEKYMAMSDKLLEVFKTNGFNEMSLLNLFNKVIFYLQNSMIEDAIKSIETIKNYLNKGVYEKDDYSKVWFLSEADVSFEGEYISNLNALLMTLNSHIFDSIKEEKSYKDLIKIIEEKL